MYKKLSAAFVALLFLRIFGSLFFHVAVRHTVRKSMLRQTQEAPTGAS